MQRGLKHALAVAAATLSVLAAAPASAHAASAPPVVGRSYASTIGMPHSMKEGRAYYAHTWYRQTSKYTMAASDFQLSVWSTSTTSTRGVSVAWLNPLTHRWQAAQKADAHDFMLYLESNPKLNLVAPGKWARIDFRITFSKSVRTGTWHVMPTVPEGYSLLNANGKGVWASLAPAKQQQFAFKVYR